MLVHEIAQKHFILCLLILVGACQEKQVEQSKLQVFTSPGVIEEEILDQKLSFTDAEHQIVRQTVDEGQFLFDKYLHEVRFSPMKQSQFEAIKQHFSSWSLELNSARYQADSRYQLRDFLPPTMKALLGRRFQAEVLKLNLANGNSLDASVVANCWGTMYEIIREAQTPSGKISLFYAHDDVMKSFVFDELYSREVKPFSKDPLEFSKVQIRNQNLKPGDVLLIGRDYLYHVAIYLDKDLFFEKSGSGDKTLFRLTTFDILAKTWFPEVYGWSFRRFDRKPLPDPMEIFGISKVFGQSPATLELPEAIVGDLSAIRRENSESESFLYFARKSYHVEGGELEPL